LNLPAADTLDYKEHIDDRDEFLSTLAAYLALPLGDKPVTKSETAEGLILQMKELNRELEEPLQRPGCLAVPGLLQSLGEVQQRLVSAGLAEVTPSTAKIEDPIVSRKIRELADAKDALALQLTQFNEEFIKIQNHDLFRDPDTGYDINSIFVDFMLHDCENIERRLAQLRKAQDKGQASSKST
jgi:hypothetical protein